MKKIMGICGALLLLSLEAQAAPGIKIGVLTCDVDRTIGFIVGSSTDVACRFSPTGKRRAEFYSGSIGKLGLDLGVTSSGKLAWVVFAPGNVKRGALRGSYTGVGAQATAGIGLGANVLIGGFRDTINLQPISLQVQTGLNVAAGISSMTLRRED